MKNKITIENLQKRISNMEIQLSEKDNTIANLVEKVDIVEKNLVMLKMRQKWK